MDELNTTFGQILNTSLESIQLLKEDILVIRSQLRGILIPFQWTVGVITSKMLSMFYVPCIIAKKKT